MSYVFREYQQEIENKVADAIRRGVRSMVVRAPTGSGKTVIFTRMSARAEVKDNHSMILVPRRELAFQAVEKLVRFGATPGMIMAGEPMHYHRKIQVCSFDTLHARAMKTQKIQMPSAKLVIPDEAHLSIAPTRLAIIQGYKNSGSIIVAFTATPARSDGLSLGRVYDELIHGWTTRQMMDAGYLVRARYICPSPVDLSKLKVNPHTGDFDEDILEGEFDRPKLVGDLVENWIEFARGRRTAVFCITRKHARHVLERFVQAGVSAEYVDGETPHMERAAIFRRLASGHTQVLVNVFVATVGLDIPRIDCVVLARPTKSLVLYHQVVGRGLRPFWDQEYETVEERLAAIAASEKPDLLVIDHAGAVDLHGFVDDDVPWSLADDGKTVSQRKVEKQEEEKAPKELTCPQCKTVFKGARNCPQCGFALIGPSEPVPFYKAKLVEVRPDDGKAANRKTPWAEKIQFFGEAKGYAAAKGYADGWAAHKYREKFGVWPNDPMVRHAEPRQPTALLMGFITHLAMRRSLGGRR